MNNLKIIELRIVLSEMSFLNGSAVEAYLCRECQKIIIDYTDVNCDLNKK